MRASVRALALLLLFLLELAVLVIGARWGWALETGLPLRLLSAVAVPLLLAALWGVYGSPKARITLPVPARYGFQAAWFAAGGALLASLAGPLPGVALVAVWAATAALVRLTDRPT
ncbi:DUF2568 domain-containing protein [Micromonospora sp. 15K316]|uniref:YrdB family protein n=1 Tax=Micromonospora sp. 15K316 TaxID=2530376 RepID=UPI00105142EC|nr:YrdB family protein [Micromonospora sp. 15K316]TDC39516.1 DUF2568 domain-containing protein [Micromonospora sp. 15K316]